MRLSDVSVCCCVVAVSNFASSALAQRANFGVQIGERAIGMGGAFTAVANDSSASWHNPGGLSQIRQRGLSLSATTYSWQQTRIAKFIEGPSGETTPDERGTPLIYPNATIYVKPLNVSAVYPQTVAFSILVPYTQFSEGVQNLSLDGAFVDLDLFTSSDEKVYMAGPSWAVQLGKIHLGATLLGQYVTFSTKQQLSLTLPVQAQDQLHTSRLNDFDFTEGTFMGATAILGALYKPLPELSTGLRIGLPNLRLAGEAKSHFSEARSTVATDQDGGLADLTLYQDVFRSLEGKTHYRTPLSVSAGLAWQITPKLMLSADLDYYFPLKARPLVDGQVEQSPANYPGEFGTDGPRSHGSIIDDPGRERVLNGAVGLAWDWVPGWAALCGGYTDFSAVPDAGIGELAQVNRLGATIAVSRQDDKSTLMVGLSGTHGRGKAMGLLFSDTGIAETTPVLEQWSATVFVAGSALLDPPEKPESL